MKKYKTIGSKYKFLYHMLGRPQQGEE